MVYRLVLTSLAFRFTLLFTSRFFFLSEQTAATVVARVAVSSVFPDAFERVGLVL